MKKRTKKLRELVEQVFSNFPHFQLDKKYQIQENKGRNLLFIGEITFTNVASVKGHIELDLVLKGFESIFLKSENINDEIMLNLSKKNTYTLTEELIKGRPYTIKIKGNKKRNMRIIELTCGNTELSETIRFQ